MTQQMYLGGTFPLPDESMTVNRMFCFCTPARGKPNRRLFVISTQIQLAFVIDQTKSHLLNESTSA